jgi:hypothetical protein
MMTGLNTCALGFGIYVGTGRTLRCTGLYRLRTGNENACGKETDESADGRVFIVESDMKARRVHGVSTGLKTQDAAAT